MNTAHEALARFTPETAWKPYYPTASDPWDIAKVAHLYRRAAFGATWEQIESGSRSAPAELVTQLLSEPAAARRERFDLEYSALAGGLLSEADGQEAKALWLFRMLYTPQPARERLTLIWHNHFATSNAKVRRIRLLTAQVETLRRHALGNFGALLSDMTRDPAMLLWLDASANRRGAPNENYAREVMELFSLGVGHYTERDIQEAARALTGWSVQRTQAVFDPGQHDPGEKTIFGQTGRFSGGDVVRLCLGREDCARFITRRFVRELVSDAWTPTDEMLAPLAQGFRDRDYDIRWLAGTILKSWLFYSPVALRRKVKGPIDLLVGTVVALEGRPPLRPLAEACDQLGQSLYHPPGVQGWEGGTGWLNSSTLLRRQNLAVELTGGTGPAARVDPARLVERYRLAGITEIIEFFLLLLHQRVDVAARDRIREQIESERPPEWLESLTGVDADAARTARAAAHLALTMPEYQLF